MRGFHLCIQGLDEITLRTGTVRSVLVANGCARGGAYGAGSGGDCGGNCGGNTKWTGAGTAILSPTRVNAPVTASMRNVNKSPDSWFALMRNFPDGSMPMNLGLLPPEET